GFHANLGFNNSATTTNIRNDAFWFGEAQSRVVVSVSPTQEAAFVQAANEANITITHLGVVTDGNLTVNDEA
ncbi:MAG TPA: hypothetical protein DCL43_08770, partial [Chitinophagaceae bacterium]|nr:hypothetical protein [Chitinophagaceae bacterium]